PFRRSAGAFARGSGSGIGNSGPGTLTFGGFGGAKDFPLPNGEDGLDADAAESPAPSRLSSPTGPAGAGRVLAPPDTISTAAPAPAPLISGATPFFVCFAMTSRRCFS